jgi:hypothetical protein
VSTCPSRSRGSRTQYKRPKACVQSSSLASYDLSQPFTNPDYINNVATIGTAIDLPSSFTSAAPELKSYLSAGCGASVASCASQSNPYAPSAANAAAKALAAFYGTPLSSWSRINLCGAAGYFRGVTGALTLASTDVVKTDVTIDANGKLGGTGVNSGNVANPRGAIAPSDAPGIFTITGNLIESQPSELDILLGGTTPGTEYSQLIVDGTASLLGGLDLNLAEASR